MDELTALVASAARGDERAFEALVRRYQARTLAIAIGIVRDADDARDVCQEAWIKVHRALPSFDGRSRFFTWLYRIVTNLAIDFLRRHRKTSELDEATMAADERSDPARRLAARQEGRLVCAALDAMSPLHRSTLVLREVEGLSYAEIAETLGCPIGTVMSRLFHARQKLAAELSSLRRPLDLAA